MTITPEKLSMKRELSEERATRAHILRGIRRYTNHKISVSVQFDNLLREKKELKGERDSHARLLRDVRKYASHKLSMSTQAANLQADFEQGAKSV